MTDLALMYLQSDPNIHAGGRIIKPIYFSRHPDGARDLVAFWVGCAGVLDGRPFLQLDFADSSYLYDQDGDGCADGAGSDVGSGFDPADFFLTLPPARRVCAAL